MYALTDSRDMLKRILNFPPETILTWKSHDSSIQQRTAIDDARKEKTLLGPQWQQRRGEINPLGQEAKLVNVPHASEPLRL